MRINYLKPLLGIGSVAILALYSCHGNGSAANGQNSGDTLTKPAAKAVANDDQDSVTYMLPSPLQIASIYKNAGLTYIDGVTAERKDADKFNSQYDKSLNMGIYSADLLYCILQKQNDNSMNYLASVKGISDKLGFGSIFTENSFLKRFQANMNNADTLTGLMAELQMETDTYLENNKKKYIGVIAFAGAWVESMHTGYAVYEKTKSASISSRISEEMNILDNLIKVLGKYRSDDNNIGGLIDQLNVIKSTYDGFDEVKSNNPDNDQVIALTNDHLDQLGKLINALRDKFMA